MKILVADDDTTLREELAGLLREDGHAIVTALVDRVRRLVHHLSPSRYSERHTWLRAGDDVLHALGIEL